jgi:hypothetical protein
MLEIYQYVKICGDNGKKHDYADDYQENVRHFPNLTSPTSKKTPNNLNLKIMQNKRSLLSNNGRSWLFSFGLNAFWLFVQED